AVRRGRRRRWGPRVPCLGTPELDSLSDWIGGLEILLRERLVDERHRRALLAVPLVQESAADEPRAHRAEIAGRDRVVAQLALVIGRRAALHGRVAGPRESAQRQRGRAADGVDAGHRAQAGFEILDRAKRL